MKRIAFLAVLLLIVGVIPFAMRAGGPQPKVDICHFDGQGVGHVINVSENAKNAHLGHHDGDCLSFDENDNGTCTCTPPGCSTNGECDDGMFCTLDFCDESNGECVHGPLDCDDNNECTIDSCDEEADFCDNAPVADGTACDDGNAGTQNDVCLSGVCQGT